MLILQQAVYSTQLRLINRPARYPLLLQNVKYYINLYNSDTRPNYCSIFQPLILKLIRYIPACTTPETGESPPRALARSAANSRAEIKRNDSKPNDYSANRTALRTTASIYFS